VPGDELPVRHCDGAMRPEQVVHRARLHARQLHDQQESAPTDADRALLLTQTQLYHEQVRPPQRDNFLKYIYN